MKNIQKIGMALLPILLRTFSCHQKNNLPIWEVPDPPDEPVDTVQHIIPLGKISMLRNGTYWSGNVEGRRYGNIGWLQVVTYYANGIRETFRLLDFPLELGIAEMEPTNVNNFNGVAESGVGWTLDQDQILGYLYTTSEIDNKVEITRYDSLTNEVEGTFQYKMVNSSIGTPSYWGLPDSLTITEGKFHVKLK